MGSGARGRGGRDECLDEGGASTEALLWGDGAGLPVPPRTLLVRHAHDGDGGAGDVGLGRAARGGVLAVGVVPVQGHVDGVAFDDGDAQPEARTGLGHAQLVGVRVGHRAGRELGVGLEDVRYVESLCLGGDVGRFRLCVRHDGGQVRVRTRREQQCCTQLSCRI